MHKHLVRFLAIVCVLGLAACGASGTNVKPASDVQADGQQDTRGQVDLIQEDGVPQEQTGTDLAGDVVPDAAGDVLPDVAGDAVPDVAADLVPDVAGDVVPDTHVDVTLDGSGDVAGDVAADVTTELTSDVDTDAGCLGPDGEICCLTHQDCQGKLVDVGEAPCTPAICQEGYCVVAEPLICVAVDPCHGVGECDAETGLCSSPQLADGTYCDEGACKGGQCVNLCATVKCASPGECLVGTCDIHTGQCGGEPDLDGLVCSIGVCQQGECVDLCDQVICQSKNDCHLAMCISQTGQCLQIPLNDGMYCPQGVCQGGECLSLCDQVVCPEPAPCQEPGVCDVHTGLCNYDDAPDGQGCGTGICQQGVCVNLCQGIECPAKGECELEGVCDPTTGECNTVIAPDNTACGWGSCQLGSCFGIQDGSFLSGEPWAWLFGGYVNPLLEGSSSMGVAIVPAGSTGFVSQLLANVPQSFRLRARMDHKYECTDPQSWECMMFPPGTGTLAFNGVTALVGYGGPGGWSSTTSCLGESAYGTDVMVSLQESGSMMGNGLHFFDNVQLEVVDKLTCPAVGKVLNGDAAGTFGWTPCAAGTGAIEYATDEQGPYVRVARSGNCQEIVCMSTWVSVPKETTMGNPVMRFDYKTEGVSSGGYNFIVMGYSGGAIEYLNYDSSTWKSVSTCIGSTLQGRAEQVRFNRGTCGNGVTEYIQLRNVRIENDPVACP